MTLKRYVNLLCLRGEYDYR